jgi:glycosyltransferase involved in cell wall biosynthesis
MEKHTQSDITLVIPSSNNLRHLKNCYASIKRNASDSKIIFLDDGSTDCTTEWLSSIEDNNIVALYRSSQRIGHTILYDKGIQLAETSIVGILHADMIIGPKYIENMLKHIKPGVVVCGTRVEPPLHPEGKEKIVKDFGMDFDSLNVEMFEEYVDTIQLHEKDKTTKGMFAPWILYKEDFVKVGGHDKIFAPFPYEDSDIFQRWIMAGYELIQSRDALVYHLTCRGHRWNQEIGKDDDYFKKASSKAARNYLRKWGSWIKNDEYQYPIIPKKYNIGIVIEGVIVNTLMLDMFEPWCTTLYVEEKNLVNEYIARESSNTLLNLSDRVKSGAQSDNDILIYINTKTFNERDANMIGQLQEIIFESGEEGQFELGNMRIEIKSIQPVNIPIKPLFSTT